MKKVMIDSSVWIDYFKKSESPIASQVNELLDDNQVYVCGMVELEIVQGLRGKESEKIQALFDVLNFVETDRKDFRSAGLILNQLRSKGITIPSSDCLIASLCIRYHLSLLTLDKDFDHINMLKKHAILSN